ncbi:MAG: hypothetical protein SGPRY_013466, partial [Prymnesium sp.]
VPDIYDCAKYDLAHNMIALGHPASLLEVHEHVKPLAQLVVPLEYGSTLQVTTHPPHSLIKLVYESALPSPPS